MITAARRRIAQFWRHSSAWVTPAERVHATDLLGPSLTPLFLGLPVNEQRHALDVLATLERLGERDRVLQQAALLHDMGKAAARFSILDRSLAVFLQAVSPRLFGQLLAWLPGYRRRYEVYQQHAAIGAARLEGLGATELAAVIAEHHAPAPALERTRRLRRADGLN
jgi:CRISPR-associated nuclease/helicase Cas3-like protein